MSKPTLQLLNFCFKVNESIKTFMEESLKENLNYFKNKNKLKINLEKDNNFDISEYIIEFKSKNNKILEKIENVSLLKNSLINEKSDNKKIIKFKKKNFYKKKFFKKKAK